MSERANGQASDPVLTSRFLVDPVHSALIKVKEVQKTDDEELKVWQSENGDEGNNKYISDNNNIYNRNGKQRLPGYLQQQQQQQQQ